MTFPRLLIQDPFTISMPMYVFPFAGVDLFDSELFNMARNEAAATDPQHRMLLEEALVAWSGATHAARALLVNSTGEYCS